MLCPETVSSKLSQHPQEGPLTAHLALFPQRFTAQFDFAFSNLVIRTRKYILHRWVRRDRLISAQVTTSSPRLKARA